MDEKVNQHEGTPEEKGDGLGGEQVIASDLEEHTGKGARLDQAAPTPEKQMENQQGMDDAEVSTGTNPTPTTNDPSDTQKSSGGSDSGSA
ncbi:MAG: hypothetical protein H0U53_00715 [Actinobacteria bacterium]|nr:hypothetical protein [Actinomycetota bacterium]